MWPREWQSGIGGHRVRVVHEVAASLRSRASLHVDDAVAARSAWRWHALPIDLQTVLPGGGHLTATVGYARNWFTRVRSVRLDGCLVDGADTVPDTLSEQYPTRLSLAQALMRTIPEVIVCHIIMFAAGVMSTDVTRAPLFAGMMFWLSVALVHWTASRWVAADRARR